MEHAKYSVKQFPARSNIQKTMTICKGPCHRNERQFRPKGSGDNPLGSLLLDRIAFAAEFTFYGKPGCFCFCAAFRMRHFLGQPQEQDKPVVIGTGCRSPPFVLIFHHKNQNGGEQMKTINLRDYYPFFASDHYIEVPDEVAALLLDLKRYEAACQRRTYRHKAHYSLDRNDGIEHDILFVALSPCEIYERKVTREQLHAAIASLPDKQAKRIYAHYFLGMSKAAIAKAEGVGKATVGESIERGLKGIEKFLKKFL